MPRQSKPRVLIADAATKEIIREIECDWDPTRPGDLRFKEPLAGLKPGEALCVAYDIPEGTPTLVGREHTSFSPPSGARLTSVTFPRGVGGLASRLNGSHDFTGHW